MLDAMKIGDKVKTIGGVCGYLYEINNDENTIVLETGTADKKSYVKFDRAAIYQTAPVKGIACVNKICIGHLIKGKYAMYFCVQICQASESGEAFNSISPLVIAVHIQCSSKIAAL